MASYSPVRSVERALRVLEELNRTKVSTVADLHLRTNLPKPTIVRLLQTLVQNGFVNHDVRQSGYRLTSKVMSLSSGFHSDPLVVEAGRAYAIAITKKMMWPASISILDGTSVVVRFSTIPDSPISPFHATVNMRLSLDRHAMGLAYLAFCPIPERKILIQSMREKNESISRLTDETETVLLNRLSLIKRQGFAERVLGEGMDNSNTIAVPIHGQARLLGTLGLTYFRSAVWHADAVREFLEPLQTAASHISSNVTDLT